MIRTILVTKVRNRESGVESELYGRYDPVAIERQGLQILDSFKRKYKMTDATFAAHGEAVIENE